MADYARALPLGPAWHRVGSTVRTSDPDFDVAAALPGVDATLVPYEATWRLKESLADGEAVLRGVLQGIAAHGGHHRVMVAGQSLGAWSIGEVLAHYAGEMAREGWTPVGEPGVAAAAAVQQWRRTDARGRAWHATISMSGRPDARRYRAELRLEREDAQ